MAKKLTVINDIHLGVLRGAGTTPTTQMELRRRIMAEFKSLVDRTSGDLMILGDLFDTNCVPMLDWFSAYQTLWDWIDLHSSGHLYLVAGNHDVSKTSNVLSSFQLLSQVLRSDSAGRKKVTDISQPMDTRHGYVIPHLANQDLFDDALRGIPNCQVLYLHCNYDNKFAAQSDQSLNLSAESADTLLAEGVGNIVIAHEHQTKKVGRIWIPGNQVVSSVSDCLGATTKRYLEVEDGKVKFVPFKNVDEIFRTMDWKALVPSDMPFIRVEGSATGEEAAEAVSAISRYRAESNALVITNAVKIAEGEEVQEAFAASLQDVKAFNVMEALREVLTPEEYTALESLE